MRRILLIFSVLGFTGMLTMMLLLAQYYDFPPSESDVIDFGGRAFRKLFRVLSGED